MPNIEYQDDKPSRKLTLPSLKVGGIGRVLGILVLTVLVYLVAAVLAGVISALSANVDVTELAIIFDPQITIAYILVYYSTNHFYKFSSKQTYLYFVFALVLSFTTNFIQGTIIMLSLPPLLRRLKLISAPASTA